MSKPNTFSRVGAEFGAIAQFEILRGFLVKPMELGAQYVNLEAIGFSDIHKEVLECANDQVAGTMKQI